MGGRRVAVALGSAVAAIVLCAPPVAAECATDGIPPTLQDFVGHAFTATVVDISDRVDSPVPGAAPFDWRVVLDVTHVYRGAPPDRIVANGWDAGCGDIPVTSLTIGGEVFMSTDRFGPRDEPRFWGRLLLWHRVGDGWKFHDAAVGSVEGPPAVATEATTTIEILRLVAPESLPDTATEPVALTITDDHTLFVAVVVLLAVAVGTLTACRRVRWNEKNRTGSQ